jgi:hypothetical protein
MLIMNDNQTAFSDGGRFCVPGINFHHASILRERVYSAVDHSRVYTSKLVDASRPDACTAAVAYSVMQAHLGFTLKCSKR